MNAAWVAGSVRSVALARRRLDRDGVREIAASSSSSAAIASVARSSYGHDVRAEFDLADAEHAVAATVLWNARVLAGWLPAAGVTQLRLLAGWFEVANVDTHMDTLDTVSPATPAPMFQLGHLATAWPHLATTGSIADLRAALAASAWGDPGAGTSRDISLFMRLSWADRVASGVPLARPWAAGAAALVVARERFAAGRALPAAAAARARRLLGASHAGTTTLDDFTRSLPAESRWSLSGLTEPTDLWRAEARWWGRLHRDGATLLRRSGVGPHRPLGAAALLAADAWQTAVALQIAGHGGGGREVLDEGA
ncbi:MAG TPA: hypothetical protein VFR11_16300 [Micromonosporaceae bacterium]|nr:hypothetical protein [Micromonosporaceae bacterium]